jgi:hypothetical protein
VAEPGCSVPIDCLMIALLAPVEITPRANARYYGRAKE